MQNNLMRNNLIEIIKKAILAIVVLIMALLLVLMIQTFDPSDVFNFKNGSSSKKSSNKNSDISDKDSARCMEATVTSDTIINLGDFIFVLAENRKLGANISFKYKKINRDSDGLLNSEDAVAEEIKVKNSILRDKVISLMLDSPALSIDNREMKQAIINTLNKNLTTIKVEEIYFNKFIMY